MKTEKKRWVAAAFLLLALCAWLLPSTRLFRKADTFLADALYQRGSTSSGKIVLIELDEKTLAQFGTTPAAWNREIYAQVLNNLNQSEDCHPAVIGLDVLFTYDKDPAQDQALAEAAQKFGNVITAEKLVYETVFSIDGDAYRTGDIATDMVSPYKGLKAVTTQGIVNSLKDPDGVIRHVRLHYEGVNGQRLPSFPLAVAQKYRADLALPAENDLYLEYTFPSGGYSESISLLDVYNGEIPAAYFNGKIVLIGAYASALQDEYRTAVDRVDAMYGVEIHANAVDMLLKGSYHREVPDGVQMVLYALVLVGCILIFWKAPLPWMVAAWLTSTAGSLLVCNGLYLAGYVLHPLWIPAGATALLVAGIAIRVSVEAAQRKHLREQFSKYVDPQVLNQIVRQGDMALEGSKRNIAVLFVDICGFTTLSESRKPEEVVEILNRFLGLMTDCVMKNHGTLDKFVGDCCMAFWNAPLTQADPVMLAVRAGMDMVAASEKLNQQLGIDLGFAVGIHCGEAVVGNIGCDKRMDYTAVGDTVNTASRLESLKIPGQPRAGCVYISQEVVDQLSGRITAWDLGTHPMKGKKSETRIYSVTEILERDKPEEKVQPENSPDTATISADL